MKTRTLIAAAVLALCASVAFAASTVTATVTQLPNSGIVKYSFVWVAHTDGVVSTGGTLYGIRKGRIVQAEFVPGSGALQPDDNYDVTFSDSNGVDLLVGAGANLDMTNSTMLVWLPAPYYDATAPLTFAVSGAGSANGGTFVLWVAP